MHPSIITKETTNTSSIPLNIHNIHIGSLAHPSRNVIAAHPPSNAANTNQIRKNPVPDPFQLIQNPYQANNTAIKILIIAAVIFRFVLTFHFLQESVEAVSYQA